MSDACVFENLWDKDSTQDLKSQPTPVKSNFAALSIMTTWLNFWVQHRPSLLENTLACVLLSWRHIGVMGQSRSHSCPALDPPRWTWLHMTPRHTWAQSGQHELPIQTCLPQTRKPLITPSSELRVVCCTESGYRWQLALPNSFIGTDSMELIRQAGREVWTGYSSLTMLLNSLKKGKLSERSVTGELAGEKQVQTMECHLLLAEAGLST